MSPLPVISTGLVAAAAASASASPAAAVSRTAALANAASSDGCPELTASAVHFEAVEPDDAAEEYFDYGRGEVNMQDDNESTGDNDHLGDDELGEEEAAILKAGQAAMVEGLSVHGMSFSNKSGPPACVDAEEEEDLAADDDRMHCLQSAPVVEEPRASDRAYSSPRATGTPEVQPCDAVQRIPSQEDAVQRLSTVLLEKAAPFKKLGMVFMRRAVPS